MQRFNVNDLSRQRAENNSLYLEFLRVPSMSAGVYELAAGADDPQKPHTEDELYYVMSGMATLLVGEEDIPVAAGSLVFVPARVPHHFHAITEALTILVFFSPAEYTNDAQSLP